MNPRPQATGAKPLSKKELQASLDRVVEERDRLREELAAYAEPRNWFSNGIFKLRRAKVDAPDVGERARAARRDEGGI